MKERRQTKVYEDLVREMENLMYLIQQGQQNQQQFMTEAFRLLQAQSRDVQEMRYRVSASQQVVDKLEEILEKMGGVQGAITIGPDGKWQVGADVMQGKVHLGAAGGGEEGVQGYVKPGKAAMPAGQGQMPAGQQPTAAGQPMPAGQPPTPAGQQPMPAAFDPGAATAPQVELPAQKVAPGVMPPMPDVKIPEYGVMPPQTGLVPDVEYADAPVDADMVPEAAPEIGIGAGERERAEAAMQAAMDPGVPLEAGAAEAVQGAAGTSVTAAGEAGVVAGGAQAGGDVEGGAQAGGIHAAGMPMMPATDAQAMDAQGAGTQVADHQAAETQAAGDIPVAEAGPFDQEAVPVIRPETPVAKAAVRFLHASPDAPNVDIYVDGKRVASDIEFQGISTYFPFTATRHKVQVFPAGKQVGAVIDTTVQLKPNKHYTIAAAGVLQNIRPVVIEDVRTGGKPKFARLKVVHLITNAPAVDVTLPSGKVLLGHLTFKEASPYLQVTPGTRNLEIRLARKKDTVLKLPNIKFDPDITYSLYLLGIAGQEITPLFIPEA